MSKPPPIFNPQTLKRQLGLLVVLGLLYLGGIYLRRDWPQSGESSSAATTPDERSVVATSLLQENMASLPLVLTRHGQCRMDCRGINLEEVRTVLLSGRLNTDKSEPYDQPCPTYAVEGRTADGQDIRIVFAACERETRVVTAIDLGGGEQCECE